MGKIIEPVKKHVTPPKPKEAKPADDGNVGLVADTDLEDAYAREAKRAGLPVPCRGCGR